MNHTGLLDTIERHLRNVEHRRDGSIHADCPYCGAPRKRGQVHFRVFPYKDGHAFKCQRGNCGAGGGLIELAKHLGILKEPDPDDWWDAENQQMVTPNEIYDYVDENGVLLIQVGRLPANSDGEKRVRQRRPDSSNKYGWRYSLGNARRVLYRLPEVIKTAQAGGTIFVVEGEKDANRLAREGLTATTNIMGAGKWRAEYSESLRGAGTVVILADNDDAGYSHARDVYDATTKALGLATTVIVVGFPEQPEKSDISEWLDSGILTIENLVKGIDKMLHHGAVTNNDAVHDRVFNRPNSAKPAAPPTAPEPPRPTAPPVASVDVSRINLNKMPEIDMPEAWDYHCWLDDYIAFSREWSPRSWEGFHEDCGLWLMSTVAARRVAYNMGKRRYPSLYIALAARSSFWAKSTATEIATDVLDKAGLSFFRVPDEVTPQAFIKHLTRFVPPDWNTLDSAAKEEIKRRLAFAAQVSWFYEEFGQKLDAMMRQNGVHADFRGILRRFDDHAERYESTTITRGIENVDKPYLSLLANMTPADLKPYAAKGSPLWQDGFFARFGFSVPDEGTERSTARFPSGQRIVPNSILKPLVDFHQRLGVPVISVEERYNEKGEGTGAFSIEGDPLPQVVFRIEPEVEDAYYRYHDGLLDITAKMGNNTDFDSSYARFAEKAMRIATLLAAFDDANSVKPHHWWRAVLVTERWRRGLHTLVEQLQGDIEYEEESSLEQRILGLLQEAQGPVAERSIYKKLKKKADDVRLILERMYEEGLVSPRQMRGGNGKMQVLWEEYSAPVS